MQVDDSAEFDIREHIAEFVAAAGVRNQRKLVGQLISTSIGMGLDGTARANLKLSAAALSEMRDAFQLFASHAGTPKVTIFGSARTASGDPLWAQAERTASGLAQQGWMVVTGAGPGIMEAAAHGAGADRSLGVSIRLPFEEQPNEMLNVGGNHVAMKYFFTRKLMLVKESSGFVCLPGGFGTLDETFELLTLQQTGKMAPTPIVLLDRPGGGYWRGFASFVREQLAGAGLVSPDDLDRVLITDSVEDAVAEISGFWRIYDSLRWVPDREGAGTSPARDSGAAGEVKYDRLVLRLRSEPSDRLLEELSQEFSELLQSGRIERADPSPEEIADGDRLDLARITFVPNPYAIGGLHRIIRALNARC